MCLLNLSIAQPTPNQFFFLLFIKKKTKQNLVIDNPVSDDLFEDILYV